MNYIAEKVEGQNLMFRISMVHNEKDIFFFVSCAKDESEIPSLIKYYLQEVENT
jgi:hypothetical protein